MLNLTKKRLSLKEYKKLVESEVARKDMEKLQNEEIKYKETIIAENPCGCREREREREQLFS